jgi:chromosome partitioning protein
MIFAKLGWKKGRSAAGDIPSAGADRANAGEQPTMTTPASPADYEAFVAQCFRELGCRVEIPDNPNQEAWDFTIMTPAGHLGAVQVKSRKGGALPHPIFNRLGLYLSGPEGLPFKFGINIVNTAFSGPTMTVLQNASPEVEDMFVYGGLVRFPSGKIEWQVHRPDFDVTASEPEAPQQPQAPEPVPPPKARRVAVFTEKGGVGKTSVAAHLAGAMVYCGRDAVLVDVDKQKNLSQLLGTGVNVIDRHRRVSTLVIEAELDEINEEDYKNFYIVYDCAPHFDANPREIFERVTDTVIPIVLSPLSILGNAEVIHRTISSIRGVNPDMRFHIVINQYEQSKSTSGHQKTLLNYIRFWLQQNNLLKDPKVKFYEPAELSIRRSAILLNWGMFLLKAGEEPRLAFESNVSGAQNLLSDFVALAESVQDTFELAEG